MLHYGKDYDHAAPPPYPDEICTFGSFADRRYELTKAFNQGAISQETWERECLALPGRPETGTPCRLDQLSEMLAVWHQRIREGITTEEAVRRDCLHWVTIHQGDEITRESCQMKGIRNEP